MALKGVKSLVPRGALLARHAPHEPNPFPQVNTHDNTAAAAHRGVRRDAGLAPLSWETSSRARHALLGLLCDVVRVSDLALIGFRGLMLQRCPRIATHF